MQRYNTVSRTLGNVFSRVSGTNETVNWQSQSGIVQEGFVLVSKARNQKRCLGCPHPFLLET